MGNLGGRPVKWKTPEDMQRVIDLYFIACRVHQSADLTIMDGLSEADLIVINGVDCVYPTITGLALALDMTREGLLHYAEKSDEFADTIKKAKARVEAFIEQRLYGNSATGCIFNLKNNFGWKDKSEQELSTPPGRPFETKDMSEKEQDARLLELLGKTGVALPAGVKAKPKGKK